MSAHAEYLRRNLLVCGAVGAQAGTQSAIERLRKMKHPQKWLLEALRGIEERVEPLAADLARWRDSADDAPGYVKD